VAVPLTSLSHGAGCGCKLPAAAIGPLLARLDIPAAGANPNVLVGFEGSDDAGVYRLRDDLAIVQTVDFFTPIVDDPFAFGQIAAANALSDVYAMGAEPISALNLVAFPLEQLGPEVLSEILRGGADTAQRAGVAIIGGHSIDDPEPKYGMAVTGIVHPDEVLTNAGGRAGDRLVLTKPLGAGAVTTALKRGVADAPLASAVAVNPERFNGVYGGSKAFMLALSQALTRELNANGVIIQTVLPGATRTEIWERAGTDVDAIILPERIMDLDEMVDAALAGFDQGERITIPSLPDAGDWQRLVKAREDLQPNLSRKHSAARYKMPLAAAG